MTELAAARPDTAVFGVGAVEQHGPHLPLGTDCLWIQELSRRVADALGAYWVPALPFSMSECHGTTAGTVRLRPETLAEVVRDVVASLEAQGIHRIVLLNGRGGNFVLEPVIQELNATRPELRLIMPSSRSTSWRAPGGAERARQRPVARLTPRTGARRVGARPG